MKFKNTFKFSNNYFVFKKRCLSVFEYMDDWGNFNETTLPEKEEYYSNLNMEKITDADYQHGKRGKI